MVINGRVRIIQSFDDLDETLGSPTGRAEHHDVQGEKSHPAIRMP